MVQSAQTGHGNSGVGSVDRVTVEPLDILEINVHGEKSLTGKFQVAEQGTIDYPLIGRVKVAGHTPPEVAQILEKRLAKGFLKRPFVSVLAEGYEKKKAIYVWGRVREPGMFKYTTNMTLIEALTQAGGLDPLAKKGGITVTRRNGSGQSLATSTPMGDGQSAAFRLRPGDVIHVPERTF